MRAENALAAALPLSLLHVVSILAGEPELSGYVSLEPRVFLDGPRYPEQHAATISPSAVFAPEIRREWRGGEDRFTFAPYLRWDADDGERTHWDLREALWLHASGDWIWQAGVGRLFWGVTESRHLVDIVNQTDQVEDLDEEDKLGQPMISVERWTEAGSFSLILLPGFRERSFPAANARPRGALPIDTDRTEYESGDRDRRVDLALRWSRAIGSWDLGVSAFHGTSREPRLLPALDTANRLVLIPHYDVISQIGLDAQYTAGAWLWKLEAIGREGYGDSFGAVVAGVEYTLFGFHESGADLGILAEYLHDGRQDTAPPTIYDDDVFVGLRLALNDTEDTSILGGAIVDAHGTFVSLEFQSRVGEAWKLEIEARLLVNVDSSDLLLGGFRDDGFITFRLARYL